MTYPWSWYTDAAVLRAEEERIFARSWQYVGRADQLARTGDHFTTTLGRTPIVVTRAEDDVLRAFVNVCRHRGCVVAEGAGNRSTLQCPYHAWTYGLDGTLRAAPRADFDVGEVSLLPVRLERWGPFLFANAEAGAAPLVEALGGVPEEIADCGIDVDALRFHHHAEWSVAANWKLACENFLECYHCPVAHKGFSALVDVSPDAYRLEARDLVSSQFGPLRENGRAAYDAEGEVRRSQFHFLFPATALNVFPGRPNLSIGSFAPDGPERTRRVLDYFFAPDAGEAWIEELLAFDDEVGQEDAVLVERVQRGVASGAVPDGRLLGDAEQLVAHFQALVSAALDGAPA
jgi:phenylpropionate dioxygenase-like ring-hydroxylating dioxygenase large terminal subunit